MLVSIITPSFNQGKYLPDLIGSVKVQTHRPIEHIVFDGGSTDSTLDVLRAYEKDPAGIEVKWTSEKDRGQAHAVNKGFGIARGEIIGWLNSDDVYFHTRVIERVVKEFAAHPDVDVIYGNVAKISADNLIGIIWRIPRFNYERMFFDGKISQPATFVRRRVIEENKLREDVLALDYEYWLRLGKKYKFMHVNDTFAGDRDQPERISRVRKTQLRESHLAVYDEHFPGVPRIKAIWYRLSSWPQRITYRFLGGCDYLKICKRKDYLAFAARFDSNCNFIKRQLTHRIGAVFEEKQAK